jgi:hypothetical protein
MAFKRVVTQDQNLTRVQDNVQAELTRIDVSPFQNGVLLKNLALKSGANSIAHTLGRAPQVWVVTDRTSTATVYRTSWDSKFIGLQASAACTVSLWVA